MSERSEHIEAVKAVLLSFADDDDNEGDTIHRCQYGCLHDIAAAVVDVLAATPPPKEAP